MSEEEVDEEVTKIQTEIKEKYKEIKELRRKRRRIRIDKALPRRIQAPFEIPFKRVATVTHFYKERRSRISLGFSLRDLPLDSEEIDLKVSGISSMSLHFPLIYIKRMKDSYLVLEGKLVIEKMEWQPKEEVI